jgi:hypothetical protein
MVNVPLPEHPEVRLPDRRHDGVALVRTPKNLDPYDEASG